MDFTDEQIKDIGLSEEQTTKLVTITNGHEAVLQKQWDGKANENAQKIIDGAIAPVIELTKIEREKGEKASDYLKKAGEGFVLGIKSNLEKKQQELDEKIKNTKGDEVLKSQLEETKQQLNELKQKEAKWDEWEKNDYKGQLEQSQEKMTAMERRIAFNSITPAKPETVNKYEWEAKLKEWRKEVEEKNNIVLDEDDVPWAVDKENEFKKTKLEDLLKQNKEISELLAGHKPNGLDLKQATEQYEGVPFKVPSDITSQERTKLIKDYLTKEEKLDVVSDQYAKRFAEINKSILERTPKK